jgi:replicative DNA helicase
MALWKHISESVNETLQYVKDRQQGLEQPLKTSWSFLNRALLGGLMPHQVTVYGGLSGSGKTLFGSQLESSVATLNDNVYVLSFNFEMMAKMLLLRKISAKSKKSLHALLSVDYPLSEEDYVAARDYALTLKDLPIYYVEDPRIVEQMKEIFREFAKNYLSKNPKARFLVEVDHTLLARKRSSQDANSMLAELSEWVNEDKKLYPVHFILFNQLNRNIESEERMRKPSILNYPQRSDLYYAEVIYHVADNVIIGHRPHLLNLKDYGPDKIYCSEETLFMHYIKVRNGEPCIKKCRIDGKTMTIIEE